MPKPPKGEPYYNSEKTLKHQQIFPFEDVSDQCLMESIRNGCIVSMHMDYESNEYTIVISKN